MFKSLEILFTKDGFLISNIGESNLEYEEFLLISIICKGKKVIKITTKYYNVNNKQFSLFFEEKDLINSSGLNFANYSSENSSNKITESLYNALHNFFTFGDEVDIEMIKNHFSPYMSLCDSKIKKFSDFKYKKLISQNEMEMCMSMYLIHMACYISFIFMVENSILKDYFDLIDFNIEKVMYNLCKNTLKDCEHILNINLILSNGLMNNYLNFCCCFINFWKQQFLDGPFCEVMKMNIITGYVNYIVYNNEIIKNQKDLLEKIQKENQKLKQLQENTCYDKREIHKIVDSYLKNRKY